MKSILIGLGIVIGVLTVRAQSFDAFISRVYASPESLRTALVDSFMAAVPEFPYIERDTVVHYLYRGAANQITVPGDANNWSTSSFSMTRISTTDLWYYTHNFEADARLDYKFVLNGSNWITDPHNPHACTGGFGPNSELRMPQYVPPPEVDFNSGIPHGVLHDTLFHSNALGNTRRVRIYTPAGYDSSATHYGLILFHDGLDYINLGNAVNVLDNLIAQGRIQPVIAVFVPPVDREPEYSGNRQGLFTTFIVSELLPYVDSAYRTLSDPHFRATLGSSSGGDIALWLGFTHPEVFGGVAAQSSYVQPDLMSGFQSDSVRNLKIYLDLGTYDIPELIPLVRQLASILTQRGYVHQFHEYHEGHSWCNWRARLDDALEMFFPPQVGTERRSSFRPEEIGLTAYPNPFNPTTTLTFVLPHAARVQLTLFNLNGQQMKLLSDAWYEAGRHDVMVKGDGLATGIYFVRLTAGNLRLSRKVLLLK